MQFIASFIFSFGIHTFSHALHTCFFISSSVEDIGCNVSNNLQCVLFLSLFFLGCITIYGYINQTSPQGSLNFNLIISDPHKAKFIYFVLTLS